MQSSSVQAQLVVEFIVPWQLLQSLTVPHHGQLYSTTRGQPCEDFWSACSVYPLLSISVLFFQIPYRLQVLMSEIFVLCLSLSESLGDHRAHLSLFLFFRDHCLVLPIFQCLKTLFYIFCLVFQLYTTGALVQYQLFHEGQKWGLLSPKIQLL